MTYWGEDWTNAHLGPLAVDGLMLVSATALLSISKEIALPGETAVELTGKQLDKLWGQVMEVPDVDGPELPPMVKPQPQQESRLHIVSRVSTSDAEEAAKQAWIESGKSLSSQQVADMAGLSKSTAHRRMKLWERQIVR